MRIVSFHFIFRTLCFVLLVLPLSSFQNDSQPQYLQVKLVQDMTIDKLRAVQTE